MGLSGSIHGSKKHSEDQGVKEEDEWDLVEVTDSGARQKPRITE